MKKKMSMMVTAVLLSTGLLPSPLLAHAEEPQTKNRVELTTPLNSGDSHLKRAQQPPSPKVIPTGSVDRIKVEGVSASIDYTLTDPSQFLLDTDDYFPQVLILDDSNNIVRSERIAVGTGTVTLEGLESNQTYTAIVSGPYDLLGTGEPNNEGPLYELDSAVLETTKQAPISTILDRTVASYSGIGVHYNLTDEDQALINSGMIRPRVSIYKENDLVNAENAGVGLDQVVNFTGLEGNTVYRIVVSGQYDLDGDGTSDNSTPYILAEEEYKTSDTKSEPTATIHELVDINPTIVGTDQLEVHYDLTDIDQTLIHEGTIRPRVTLYEGTTLINAENATIGANQVVTFDGLDTNKEYTVHISGQYDLNEDGTTDNPAPYYFDTATFTTNPDTEYADIPDANFRKALNETLGQPADAPIEIKQLTALTGTLIYESREIRSIEGAHYLTMVKGLYFTDNEISDISPISGLTNLTDLSLENNNSSDISPLSGLTNLTYLRLHSNNISDISPLSSLMNLTYLFLDNNEISDINPLSNLTNLATLYFANNEIGDISPLSRLMNTTYLSLSPQNITLPERSVESDIIVSNVIQSITGDPVAPTKISDDGSYNAETNQLNWTGLSNAVEKVSYDWSESVTVGPASAMYSGTVTQPLTHD